MSSLYWDVNKQLGYGVRTTLAEDGTSRYRLVLPEGMTAILMKKGQPLKPATNRG